MSDNNLTPARVKKSGPDRGEALFLARHGKGETAEDARRALRDAARRADPLDVQAGDDPATDVT